LLPDEAEGFGELPADGAACSTDLAV
jgi:hypothetical protein